MLALVSLAPPLALALPGGDGEGVAVSDPCPVPLDEDDIFENSWIFIVQTFKPPFKYTANINLSTTTIFIAAFPAFHQMRLKCHAV